MSQHEIERAVEGNIAEFDVFIIELAARAIYEAVNSPTDSNGRLVCITSWNDLGDVFKAVYCHATEAAIRALLMAYYREEAAHDNG